MTALSPELMADGLVTLAGVVGLALFGQHLRHETARGSAHGPFRFAITVLLAVLVARLGFWVTGWRALDIATHLAASLLPLAALLIVEALLRRHAPLPLKAGAAGGALALHPDSDRVVVQHMDQPGGNPHSEPERGAQNHSIALPGAQHVAEHGHRVCSLDHSRAPLPHGKGNHRCRIIAICGTGEAKSD